MTDSSDTDFLRRFRDGDDEALEGAIRDFFPKIIRRLQRQFGPGLPRAELDDVLQETAMTLWQKCGAFDPAKGSLLNWAAGIAMRKAKKWFSRCWIKELRRETRNSLAADFDLLENAAWENGAPCIGADEAEDSGRSDSDTGVKAGRRAPELEARFSLAREILAMLSPMQARVLLIRMDYPSEVHGDLLAKRLDMNPATFRIHLKRARDKVAAECARRSLPEPNWER